MQVKIRVLDAAAQDLIDGFRFYEIQGAGLGQYFIDSLFADIDSLLLYAGIHPICFGTYHRLLAKRLQVRRGADNSVRCPRLPQKSCLGAQALGKEHSLLEKQSAPTV
jgi:hypothetical protein